MADALEDLLEAHRTEPRSLEETKGRNQDLGPSESDERSDRRHQRDPRSSAEKRENEDPGLRINESGQIRDHKESYADIRGNLQQQILRGSEKQRISHETGSSPYPVRPGVKNCPHYVKTGLCSFGSKCRFNHPPDLAPELPKRMWNCKYFLRGDCRFGSSCSYIHSKERDGAETMHQARTIPDSRELDPRERFQDTSDDTVVGYKRVGIEQEGSNDIGWQRMGDQEILQEQRERQAQEILQEQRERQAQENVQRETEDSVEERRLREMHAHDLENIEKQRREDIQRDRKEARLRVDQIKQTLEWNQTRDPMKEIGFGQSEGTEIKEKKRRTDDIERQRRESRLKLEKIERTVQLNEGARVREVLPELGLTRKEGDGF